jgi:glycosyltransferase involved in cell wall biosynthesis
MLWDLRWRVYYQKLKRSDRIIAISSSAKRDAMELLNIPEERIRVIYHGVDHAHFKPSTSCRPYAKYGPYFVNIGGRSDNKNQARILEAFAQLARDYPEVQLYFAGPWLDSDLAWLRTSCAKLGLGERVKHLGYVPYEDLPSLYGNALAFVFPSLEEGFGLPVLEAMASGAPVITSNRSSLPEVAGEAALLVDPHSASALAEAMRLLLDQPEERQVYREKGVSWAAHFTWQRTARETLKALEDVA